MDHEDKKNIIKSWRFYLAFLILIAVAITWSINNPLRKKGNQKLGDNISNTLSTHGSNTENSISITKNPTSIQSTSELIKKTKTLPEVIRNRNRQFWEPILPSWYGSSVKDFSFEDIYGKSHKLSDYIGKNVMLVFWATYCPPCKIEIPHLIELRNEFSEKELAIIAISNENLDIVKRFVKSQNMNYTITAKHSSLSAPLTYVQYIPTTFYIDPKGNLKLVAQGIVESKDARNIIKATE